ncbi:putative murein peptide carboxypeptidase [bacterium BMS3Bbin14]|nr:putative murein peptide carboxypeptidase [bacterium BMS3Bbin14]
MKRTAPMAPKRTIIPPPLKPGDCIGLFSPAGPARDPGRVTDGIRLLRDRGFRVKSSWEPASRNDYLAASDEVRLNEFHRLWADDEVHALMAIRGGYGCLRIVGRIDMKVLAKRPKMVIGFSDITVLLNIICQQTGMITIHGPVVTSLARSDKESVQHFFSLLTGGIPECFKPVQLEILRSGTASGVVRGGNLTTLVHLLGTPWEIAWDNALLVLEDTGEAMYRLDRMLTQLHQAGKLRRLAGLILGTFDPGNEDTFAKLRLQHQVWERVLELTEEFAYPVWGCFPVGHGQRNYSLPIGMEATMDGVTGHLRFKHVT